MRTINKISIVTQQGAMTYRIGDNINGLIISEIRSNGFEYEDLIHSEYHLVDSSGKSVVVIENCPVVIEYEETV